MGSIPTGASSDAKMFMSEVGIRVWSKINHNMGKKPHRVNQAFHSFAVGGLLSSLAEKEKTLTWPSPLPP